MEIRDTRNGSWYWVNTAVNACKHITPIDKVVYGALCTFAGCAEIHPSYEEISKRSAVSVRRCKESVKNLIDKGILSVKKGGGKGNANVYTLLKVPKGCVLCTVSKGAESDTQRVRITTAKGADRAPQIDKEVDKKKDSAETSSAPFLWKDFLEKMDNDKRESIQLIAFFFRERPIQFDSRAEVQEAIKRHIRIAERIVKAFPKQKVFAAFKRVQSQHHDVDWSLETVYKKLTN